jgi:hypothetical protein
MQLLHKIEVVVHLKARTPSLTSHQNYSETAGPESLSDRSVV